MDRKIQNTGLALADDPIADGKHFFTFAEARRRLGCSPAAAGNLLKRMLAAGLIDRVRHGHYVVRQLGVLGIPCVAEDVALAVAAAFDGTAHRMAYRSALDEHDLIVHPSRTIYVASTAQMRARTLSGRALYIVREASATLDVGAIACGPSRVSDTERALLDAARRPKLVGGVAVVAEAIVAGGSRVDAKRLAHYARRLGWAMALRRIGSIADVLEVTGLAGRLRPFRPIRSDLDLEPGAPAPHAWRDTRWHVRWPQPVDEIRAVAHQ